MVRRCCPRSCCRWQTGSRSKGASKEETRQAASKSIRSNDPLPTQRSSSSNDGFTRTSHITSPRQVVLSASICTRQGKALVSRQFVEMNRLRVEGLLAAFPKLLGTAQQHTFVETDSVRYVYQPLENQIYLLLITTKASNIVEDLGTLRLLAKVIPDVAGGLQEHALNEHAFELIFAFDEVLTTGGYKEDISLSAIRTNLAMESHEEKVYLALKQSKEEQAKAEMQRQAKTIKERQMQQFRNNMMQGNGGGGGAMGGMEGFGGGGMQQSQQGMFGEPYGQQQPQDDNPYAYMQQQQAAPAPAPPKVLAKGGMKLGGGGSGLGSKKDSLMAAMAAEDNLVVSQSTTFGLTSTSAPAPAAPPSTPLSLVLEEKITVTMNREGAVDACDVKGTLTLTAHTDAGTQALVAVQKPPSSSFNFATHPKVDKKEYEQKGILSLKGGKGFPVNRPVGVLRWSYAGEDAAPLTINCWPEDEGSGTINVNIEMELLRTDVVLQDVNILLPLGTTDPPAIESIDGVYKHDPRAGMMCWHFDQVDANQSSGSLEFRVSGSNVDAFFPVQIGFRSETLLCPIEIGSVTNSSTGASIPHQMVKSFAPETYQCV